MPQSKQPIKERPKRDDIAGTDGAEQHGKHRERDEALPGKGGREGGLNKESGRDRGGAPTRGTRQD